MTLDSENRLSYSHIKVPRQILTWGKTDFAYKLTVTTISTLLTFSTDTQNFICL